MPPGPSGAVPVPPGAPTPWASPTPGPAPAPVAAPTDPSGILTANARLVPAAQPLARISLTVLSALLGDGEVVVAAAQGWLQGVPGVAALTDRRLVLVNERPLAPTVISVSLDGDLDVQGWETPQSATVRVAKGGHEATLDGIFDRGPAYDLVNRVKARLGGG